MQYASIREPHSPGSKPCSMSMRGCGMGFTACQWTSPKHRSPEQRRVIFWKPCGADILCVSINLPITVNSYQLRVRLSLLYASVYLHYGFSTPFLPVWFSYKGASSQQIGILLSVPMFLKILIVVPIATMADRLQRVRDILWITTAAAVLSVVTLSFADRFWALLAIFTAFSLVWDPMPVLADAYAITASRAKDLAIG